MLQTLFYIPPDWLGVPALIVWLLLCAGYLLFFAVRDAAVKGGKLKEEILATLPIIVVGGAAVFWLLPKMSVTGFDPEQPLGLPVNRGLAIRGYGVMMMTAVLAGMGLVFYRCRKIGFPADDIFRLALWMVICGLAGARLFFVIQNRNHFFDSSQSPAEIIGGLFNMAEGGLVVYGSMIGSLLAAAFVIWKWKMPVWKTADLIAPGMALGLAIGRIGCLLNGCCWGGICEAPLPGIQFPAGSPPYMQQLNNGKLLGIESTVDPNDSRRRTVTDVGSGLGKEIGIERGDSIAIPGFEGDQIRHIAGTPFADNAVFEIENARGTAMRFSMDRLVTKSLAVHPTQIYSSINAFVLCGLLWFYWYARRSDGEVMALMLMLYPVSRFVLELIRNDESGQFGTELTISQWVSLLTITAGIGLFAWVRMFGSKDEIEPKNLYNQAS